MMGEVKEGVNPPDKAQRPEARETEERSCSPLACSRNEPRNWDSTSSDTDDGTRAL